MVKWLIYYYKAWTGQDPKSILVELIDDFSQGTKYPLDSESIAQFKMTFINIGVGIRMHIQKLELLQHVFWNLC